LTPLFLGVFGASLLLSFFVTRGLRDLWVARGWTSRPTRDLDLHPFPPPRIGGVAIYLSFVASIGIAFFASHYFPSLAPSFTHSSLPTILLPATLIFALGFYDDLRSVGPYTKFAVQAIAGIMLFAGGLRILYLPVLFGTRHLGWEFGLPLTILWVIGITNAFNLIDGLDGLAAGSALFSTLVVFVVAIFGQFPLVSLLTIALAGAILGFLRFNFNPATIFLGDCGSQFIGFMLSALALKGTEKAPTVIAVAIPVVSFGLPILETAISVLRRWISGRPVFTADREHIHHKLLARGMSHRQAVILLYGVSALFALLSLFLLWPTGSTLGLVLAVLGTGIWIGVQHLGYLEFGEIRRVAQRTLEQRSVFINNLAIRRATEELKVASDYTQLCQVLEAAFSNNDFDGFDLRVKLPSEVHDVGRSPAVVTRIDAAQHRWSKPGCAMRLHSWPAWNLTLELVTTNDRNYGSFEMYRLYNARPLLLDINLLISVFPVVLADSLDRVLSSAVEVFPQADTDMEFSAAEAG
jgi:UDP-GlcNAc:undecaprenyl-phosphate/decaprenyl-phosphate GlcNAc-1-phosphate transferase